MTTLIFIRHAQSEGNLRDVCSGQLDFPLVDQGFSQAERVADYLQKNYSIDAVYASDLCRTVQTARPTANAFGLDIVSDPRLREASAGSWEGHKWQELTQKYPLIYPLWMRYQMDRNDPRPEGSECREEVVERVSEALKDIVNAHPNGCVAIFCHGRMLRLLSDTWREQNPEVDEEMRRRNISGFTGGSVTVTEYSENGRFFRMLLCRYRAFLEQSTEAVRHE